MRRHDLGACPSSSWGCHMSSAAHRRHHTSMWLCGLCASCTDDRAEQMLRKLAMRVLLCATLSCLTSAAANSACMPQHLSTVCP